MNTWSKPRFWLTVVVALGLVFGGAYGALATVKAQGVSDPFRLVGLHVPAFEGAGIRADGVIYEGVADYAAHRPPPQALAPSPAADRWLKTTSATATEWTADVATATALTAHEADHDAHGVPDTSGLATRAQLNAHEAIQHLTTTEVENLIDEEYLAILAQGGSAAASNRGKAVIIKSDDERALDVRDFPTGGGSGGVTLTARAVLDLADPNRAATDRGYYITVSDVDENMMGLTEPPDIGALTARIDQVRSDLGVTGGMARDATARAAAGANTADIDALGIRLDAEDDRIGDLINVNTMALAALQGEVDANAAKLDNYPDLPENPPRVAELNNGRWPVGSMVQLTQPYTFPDEDEHVFSFAPGVNGNYFGFSRANYGGNPPALGNPADIPAASGILAVYLLYTPPAGQAAATSFLYVIMAEAAPVPTAIHLLNNPFPDAVYPLTQTSLVAGRRLLQADDIEGAGVRNFEDTNYGRAAFQSLISNDDDLNFGLHVGNDTTYLEADGTTSAGVTLMPGYYQRVPVGFGWVQVFLVTAVPMQPLLHEASISGDGPWTLSITPRSLSSTFEVKAVGQIDRTASGRATSSWTLERIGTNTAQEGGNYNTPRGVFAANLVLLDRPNTMSAVTYRLTATVPTGTTLRNIQLYAIEY